MLRCSWASVRCTSKSDVGFLLDAKRMRYVAVRLKDSSVILILRDIWFQMTLIFKLLMIYQKLLTAVFW